MRVLRASQRCGHWSLNDSYGFISTFLTGPSPQRPSISSRRAKRSRPIANEQCRCFHDYFVTHLPSSSLHPDSRSSAGPHHKLPRADSTPHSPGAGRSPAALVGASRELTVVRIPLKSAKHHFGVSVARGNRPYQEDTYQAGTIELPSFAKKGPVSLSRSAAQARAGNGEATSADGASGDPQVFYFGVFDGHGGQECSEWLRDELHTYIEKAAKDFELTSSLGKKGEKSTQAAGDTGTDLSRTDQGESSTKAKGSLDGVQMKSKADVEEQADGQIYGDKKTGHGAAKESTDRTHQDTPNTSKVTAMQQNLIKEWKTIIGGYFRRFKPEYFAISADPDSNEPPGTSIESVLMYAFLTADLDFVTAQAKKPDPSHSSDAPLNNDEILGLPTHKHKIGGPKRFMGGSTASVALISTPTPTPFWHPASPSTLVVAHVGDTRILLCSTATGLAIPLTTDHHPSSPIEGARLRRYAGTFVTDSFGEERMSGLANTRAFGDMRSKRIGVSAEPEMHRYELGPAEYSFMVLVSDGVSGTVSDQEVVDIVKEAKTPSDGAQSVVSYATEVGKEGDNATCLVVRLGGWERRGEGGGGSIGTKEMRDFKRAEANDPRRSRT